MRLARVTFAALLIVIGSLMAQVPRPGSPEAASPEVTSPPASPEVESDPVGEARPVVYRLDLHDAPIDQSTLFFFTRAYDRAESAGADAILIDVDTPGGVVGPSLQIRNLIFEADIPTYAFVHDAISAGSLISLACDGMLMAQGGTIGGSQPITAAGGLDEITNEKMTSILRAEVRAMLEAQRERDPDRWPTDEEFEYQMTLAQAFITPPDEPIVSLYSSPEVVCRAGELLTMTYREAIDERLARGTASDLRDAAETLGFRNPIIRTVQLTWSEHLARYLTSTAVASLLLLVGVVGLWIEFKAPGFGLPGIVGFTALALYFWGSYLADLSTFIEPLLVLLGFALLAIEIFVIPGFGFTGLAGVVLILVGLIMALVRLPPPEFEFNMVYFSSALNAMALAMVLTIASGFVIGRWLPRSSIWRRLELEPATISAPGAALPAGSHVKEVAKLVGMEGVALSDLRPAGTAEIAGDPYDVVTQGDFIDEGTPVTVLQVVGTRIIVSTREG